MSDTLIKVEGVSKKFCRDLKRSLWYGMQDLGNELLGRCHGGNGELRSDEFWAVKDVSFELKRGECLGFVGRNGAGKTTLLRMLNGLIKPDKGLIEIWGRVGALIALGAGFNPILTGRENIYVNASVLGFSKCEIDEKMEEIIEFSELQEFIDAPVQSYSSGMTVRLGFAVASLLSPDIMILDEVLAVGDANFQAKCFHRLGKNLDSCAVILVSHYPHHIKKYCDRVILLERGQIVEIGNADHVLGQYQKRYDVSDFEPFVVLSDNVKSASIENVSETISSGGFLEFDLILESKTEVRCDQSYLNLVDKMDVVHAQVVLTGLEKVYNKGKSRHCIRVGPLHLTAGNYSGNFVLYGSNGKSTIAHLRHCLSFWFDGPSSLGPIYYPPSEVKSD
ncbi:MAG TPA: ABC transporter ATP-binding protein [Alphaproteobacteria bacterium]|nr:ABC transporter ATP-binding protein [Alphaproteobacteria bacterium]